MRDVSLPLLTVGCATTLVWWWGAVLSYHRKRYLAVGGFFGAGMFGLVFTFTSAGVYVPEPIVDMASLLRMTVAGCFVFSLMLNQPPWGAPRPDRWLP